MDDLADYVEFSVTSASKSTYSKYSNELNEQAGELISLQIDKFNALTTFIDLDKFDDVLHDSSQSNDSLLIFFLDRVMLNKLVGEKVINWSPKLAKLYPLRTQGDGNCLCHAIMVYLFGLHDHQLILRDVLKNYINGSNAAELKKRYLANRLAVDSSLKIEADERILESDWNEVQTMNRNAASKSGDKEALLYLEEIHVFALANLLKRTIIVVSLETVRNLQANSLRGIYLPVLNEAASCYRRPIIIGFQDFHFFPIVHATHTNKKLDNLIYDDLSESKSNCHTNSYFPLMLNNFESMNIHYLTPDEEKKVFKLFNQYLTIAEVPLASEENTEALPTLCCEISDKMKPENGLNLYFDYLSQKLPKKMLFVNRFCKEASCMVYARADCSGYCQSCYEKSIRGAKPTTNYCRSSKCSKIIKPTDVYCDECSQDATKARWGRKCIICANEAIYASNYCEKHTSAMKQPKWCKEDYCREIARDECEGFCSGCYERLLTHHAKQVKRMGEPVLAKHPPTGYIMQQNVCSTQSCSNPVTSPNANNLCSTCYHRLTTSSAVARCKTATNLQPPTQQTSMQPDANRDKCTCSLVCLCKTTTQKN